MRSMILLLIWSKKTTLFRLLNNIVDLLNERALFESKDLDRKLDDIKHDVDIVDHGTDKLNDLLDKIKSKVDGIGYTAPLAIIQNKIKKLKESSEENK